MVLRVHLLQRHRRLLGHGRVRASRSLGGTRLAGLTEGEAPHATLAGGLVGQEVSVRQGKLHVPVRAEERLLTDRRGGAVELRSWNEHGLHAHRATRRADPAAAQGGSLRAKRGGNRALHAGALSFRSGALALLLLLLLVLLALVAGDWSEEPEQRVRARLVRSGVRGVRGLRVRLGHRRLLVDGRVGRRLQDTAPRRKHLRVAVEVDRDLRLVEELADLWPVRKVLEDLLGIRNVSFGQQRV
mmetsp:Transcript_1339/g.5727  ORF Transcript_1339/g.5727 Transcript_1339/m.5727 type:complete len:243 (+) Transcript_1339:783-1511(+)